jgi:tetratricopeptide (TPR) repeat protein
LDTQSTADFGDGDALPEEQLYTPAMLAQILGVSVRVVRRWHRANLLTATKEVLQLPYFDFAELTNARRLARWMKQGATVQSIQRQLRMLAERALEHSDSQSLTVQELPISAEGRRLVLRSGDHFVEATGQLRFGFEGMVDGKDVPEPSTLSFEQAQTNQHRPAAASTRSARYADEVLSLEEMMAEAIAAEDIEDLAGAIDWCRAALAAYGPDADVCFQLAELLYREGDLSGARERYFNALELNPELVEARANLGCVLAECGQPELAVAAFEGTLEQFADYADVHFHLARSLDDLGQAERACEHWQRFLELAPASPWAEEAEHRLSQATPLFEF